MVEEPLELDNTCLDYITETWDDLKKENRAHKKCERLHLEGLKTLDLILSGKRVDLPSLALKHFKTNQLQVSFYTVLMHFSFTVSIFICGVQTFLSVIFYSRYSLQLLACICEQC